MNQATKQVMDAIADDILQLARNIMASPQIGLSDSALCRDMKVEVVENNGSIVIETIFADYVQYLEQGRKPRQGKQPPIDSIRDWALSKNIPTDNSTLFLISRAIWENGFAGKPILATLEEEIERRFETQWSDQLLESITSELKNYLK